MCLSIQKGDGEQSTVATTRSTATSTATSTTPEKNTTTLKEDQRQEQKVLRFS